MAWIQGTVIVTEERRYRFLDVEASSLSEQSYPIEVAWSSNKIDSEPHCWLINPYTIDEWMDWDPGAQAVHGIRREDLMAEGVEPGLVTAHMNASLAGATVYCDGGDLDIFWIDRMFKAASMGRQFQIGDARLLFHRLLGPDTAASSRDTIIEQMSQKARKAVDGRRHRASVDVQYLEVLCELVQAAI